MHLVPHTSMTPRRALSSLRGNMRKGCIVAHRSCIGVQVNSFTLTRLNWSHSKAQHSYVQSTLVLTWPHQLRCAAHRKRSV